MTDTFNALGQAVGAGLAGAGFTDLGSQLGLPRAGGDDGLADGGVGYAGLSAPTGVGYVGLPASTGVGYGGGDFGLGGVGGAWGSSGGTGVGYGGGDAGFGYGLGYGGDPGGRGDLSQINAANAAFGAAADAKAQQLQAQAAAAASQQFANNSVGGLGDPTGKAANGADWSQVNRWDGDIIAAQQQVLKETGVLVPADRIKAHMMIESEGDPTGQNTGDAIGLMQVTPTSYDAQQIDFQRLATDPQYQIYAGVLELAERYKASENTNPDKWAGASCSYFTGSFDCGQFGQDPITGTTQDQYQAMLANYMQQIRAAGGVSSGGSIGGGGGGSIDAIWGGGPSPGVSQPYGTTDFSNANCGAMYAYAAGYGCACCHPGVDEAVSYGTKLYAPVGGTVVCAGENVGSGDPSSGCNAFCSSDTLGCQDGTGRFEMQMDNGDYLILGHMSAVSGYVTPGEHISAGQLVGLSGAENGAHVHVEVRQVGNCPVGMCTVDPTTYFGSGAASSYGGGQGAGFGAGTGQGGGGSAQGAAIVAEAQKYLGDPYVWGTHGPNTFDCSGLVSYVVGNATGMQISTGSHYQFDLGTPVSEQNLAPGDLVFWDTEGGSEVDNGNTASHVGIYIGNGQVLAAMNPSLGVKISTMASMDGMYPFLGGRRLFPGGNGSGAPSSYGGGQGAGFGAPTSPYVQASPQFGALMDLELTGSSPGYA